MKKKTIFGLTEDQIKKQSGSKNNYNLPKSPPIKFDRSPLDACISGSKKILNDPKQRKMCYNIYRRSSR